MNQKLIGNVFYLLLMVIFLSGNALAHKVTVFAWVEGNTVMGETKFSGGKRAQNAQIIVWDMEGQELLRTRTDQNGEFSFSIPKKTGMRIELLAGMGHKAEWTIPLEELGEDLTSDSRSDDVKEKAIAAPVSDSEKTDAREKTFSFANQAELEAIIEKSVEKSVDKKIRPLIKMMADLEQKEPSFSEIIGGIGYIFGLMGVALYFKSRQKKG